jgi:hypothetical protein
MRLLELAIPWWNSHVRAHVGGWQRGHKEGEGWAAESHPFSGAEDPLQTPGRGGLS